MGLLAQAQSGKDRTVTRRCGLGEVLEQAVASADHLEQPTPRCMVLLVSLEMITEVINPLGQQCDLHLGRPGVILVYPKLFNDLLFSVCCDAHTSRFTCPCQTTSPAMACPLIRSLVSLIFLFHYFLNQ